MDSFQPHLEKRLESLECHFTWNLNNSKQRPEHVLEHLERVRDRGECTWEGHLYNLLGYYHYQTGLLLPPFNTKDATETKDSTNKALSYLQKAEEILREQEAEGRGPRLLVNMANLAWVHYLLGELPESEAYLEEVAQLQRDFPAPRGCDLHPEVYGEKGWTQVKFDYDMKKEAIANFEIALRGEQTRKEWIVGLALAKYKVHFEGGDKSVKEEITELLKHAKTMDPGNLYISSLYLVALGMVDRKTEETMREAYSLVKKIKPYDDGFEDIFHFFRFYESPDKVIRLAEQFVKDYPREREAKKQLALCYRRKIMRSIGNIDQELVRKALCTYEEVIRLMPFHRRSALNLAELYTQFGNIEKADLMYEDLLSKEKDLDPESRQLLYFRYAKNLDFHKKLPSESIDFYKKAVEISVDSWEKKDSIRILEEIASDRENLRSTEMQDFLSNCKTNCSNSYTTKK